jgi:tetratricopeptide (TPR) repeat protein
MMAGRSAFARQGFKDAADYFRSVINNEKCPVEIAAEAWFALGDTLIEQGSADPTKKTDQFNEAIVVFNRITQIYPTNKLAILALGRLGDCYLHLASENLENYLKSIEFYQKVIASNADISTRSQAETSLAIVYEKLSQLKLPNEKTQFLKQALEHYLNVIYGRNIKPEQNEQPDLFWIKKAGLNAISLLETTQQWEQLINLCNRLKPLMPSMADFFSKKIIMATEKLSASRTL